MQLKTLGLALVFLIAGVGFFPTAARAYCDFDRDKSLRTYHPDYYSVAREFHRAKYIVEGRVVREIWLGDDGKQKPLKPPFQFGASRPTGFAPYMGAYYTVEIVGAFKGNPPDRVRVFSENTTARFLLNIGANYILIITEEMFSDADTNISIGVQMTVDNCGNSASLRQAGILLQALEQLSTQN
jgi:hypothetical protein